MYVTFNRTFTKSEVKAPETIRQAFRERLSLFMLEMHHPLLHNHALSGEWKGHRSINISGDWRAIYHERTNGVAVFVALGTHSQLYG